MLKDRFHGPCGPAEALPARRGVLNAPGYATTSLGTRNTGPLGADTYEPAAPRVVVVTAPEPPAPRETGKQMSPFLTLLAPFVPGGRAGIEVGVGFLSSVAAGVAGFFDGLRDFLGGLLGK